MPGPAKLPAAIHEARGTFRPDRHAKSGLPVVIPAMPRGLSKEGKSVWRSLTRKLEAAGLVANVDELSLRLLVDSVCLYDQAAREIDGKLTVTTDKGNVIQNPAVGVRNRAWAQIVKLGQLFGMSPSARTGLDCGGDEGEHDDTSSICFRVTE